MHSTNQNARTIHQPPPKHVAIIMDGNGRWAEERGLPRAAGHKKGADSVRAVVTHCKKAGVKHLTLYTFSTENWNRPQTEVDGLMTMIASTLKVELEELHQNGVCIKTIGDTSRLPKETQEALKAGIEKTKNNKDLYLSLALSYSGRDEILRMTKKLAFEASAGKLDINSLTEEDISKALDTCNIPDPDLLIRTGGDKRISNFLLWQVAYSELYMTDKFWPDFNEEDFKKALYEYQTRERKFGKINVTPKSSDHLYA